MLGLCLHKCIDGFGSMGDAVVCVKCNASSYGRLGILPVIRNDGTYVHQNEFPYILKLPEVVKWGSDWTKYTHYFDRDGKLKERTSADH